MLIKLLLIGAVLLVAAAVVAIVKIGPRNIIGMIRYDRRREGKLRVGDEAPDLALTALDGATRVTLREHQGQKPLVLVFGSYT
mgnify:FL=1